MSDIFREVDEDLRREQAKRLWKQYGNYVIAAAVVIIVAVAGYRGWQYWQARQAAATGDQFLAALQLADEGRQVEAEAALATIMAEGSGDYPVLARLMAASAKVAGGDATAAAAEFDAIAEDTATPVPLRDVARLRAAMALVDTASFADIRARIEPLAASEQPYRNTAREILGLSAFRAGELDQAKSYFDAIAEDADAPGGMGQRVTMMLDLIRARQGTPAAPAEG